MLTFTSEGKLEKNHVTVTLGDLELKIGLLGSGLPTPEEVLLASALSCLMLTVYYVAKEKDVEIKGMEGYIEGTMDPKGFQGHQGVPPGLLEVKYWVKVVSRSERIKEVLEESEKRCPLKDTLTRPVKVEVNWEIKTE
ncbi:peroxiredoxin [Sulfolobales archaeon SCGC AB-777_K20]|nr:peroxiredoxin [Sulfolobales archaeon SCGC AB-777_K20]